MNDQFDTIQPAPPIRPRPGKTSNITEEPQRISWRWFNPITSFFLVFFCLVWNGFLVFWYSIALGMFHPAAPKIRGVVVEGAASSAETLSHGMATTLATFPLMHVAVGIGMIYYTICLFVNRTEVSVADGALEVRHGPLPWIGNCKVSRATIAQLYVARRLRSSRSHGTSEYFDLAMLDTEHVIIPLIKNMPLDQAKYVEHWVEQKLGIRNQRVEGEADL